MKKQHILMVEDDAEMRETLSDILSEEGYEVETTGKGREALTLAREEKEKFPFAICLIDLKLPDISGIEMLRGLKELNPESYAIIITAFASKNTAIEALKAGAYSYIEKPVNMDELLHVIKKATESYQLQEEKKRAEEKIKELAEIHTDLRERAPVAIVNVHEDYRVDCTDRLLEWTGWSREEIEHINLVKESRFTDASGEDVVLPPLACEETIEKTEKEYIPKLIRGETLEGVYQCYNKKDGGKVDLELNSVGYFGGKEPKPENFEYTICIFSNITERKRAEEELKESRKFLESVIDNIPDTITLKDSEHRVVLVNQAYCNITGVAKHEVIGKKGEYRGTNDKVFQTGRMIENPELTYTGVEGVRHYVHSKKVPLTDESGKITHVLTISRDITERKRAEEKIRQAEKEWRDSFSSLADVMIMADTNFTIERVNKAAEELVGKPKEEIIGMKCYNVFHNIDNPPKNCPLKKSLKTKKVETIERYEPNFGRYFSEKSSPVLDENGEIIKFVYLMRDITERKRAEKELEKYTKELERANRDLEDFTSTVSHDLQAPLRSIQAFSMLLSEDYADVLDETGRGYLNKVKEAVERMGVQIEDLLTLSRVGRKFIEVETVDMNELLEEIKTDLSARIGERGGEVVVGKLPLVSTQRVWMKELFTNLIDNGLKFNRADKPKVEVNCEEREQDYLFTVRDNGIGIEEKYQANIFNLFERLHSTSEYEGTGAGLAICKKIVEGLGGEIWVESRPGEGSTFFFTIPRN
ncbi:MAG: PAS domain S-box protein [Methanophagales archaeon]|nr:PAS domain S-box protein [Methanophagales archaeon]